MLEKVQVIMHRTENPSGLHRRKSDGEMQTSVRDNNENFLWQPQYLYFITDGEIKEGDWALHNSAIYRMDFPNSKDIIIECTADNKALIQEHWRKIVATTNPDLWYSGEYNEALGRRTYADVPAIPTDFIETYVRKQGKIKEVRLQRESYNVRRARYKGITHGAFDPEWMLPPVLSGDFRLKLNSDGTVIVHEEQERKYSRKELFDAFSHLAFAHPLSSQEELEREFNENYPE